MRSFFFTVIAVAVLCGWLGAPASSAPSSCARAKHGFVGTICAPRDTAKHPAIILLGGSEGGDSMARAAELFAARGYVAASVAYFRVPGTLATLEDVPVEIVGNALLALASRSDVDPGRIGIFGFDKGGELALLAASVYPQFRAVVADVPSPFAWQGITQGSGPATSSWSVRGKPVPFVPYREKIGRVLSSAMRYDRPIELRTLYDASMKNAAAIERAFFHLERIHGPVLLLAADDDRFWDSPAQCRLAMAYLRKHHHAYRDRYLHYPNAGHLFLFATPQQPLTQADYGSDVEISFGGTPKGNVAAEKAAWPAIYAFLSRALR